MLNTYPDEASNASGSAAAGRGGPGKGKSSSSVQRRAERERQLAIMDTLLDDFERTSGTPSSTGGTSSPSGGNSARSVPVKKSSRNVRGGANPAASLSRRQSERIPLASSGRRRAKSSDDINFDSRSTLGSLTASDGSSDGSHRGGRGDNNPMPAPSGKSSVVCFFIEKRGRSYFLLSMKSILVFSFGLVLRHESFRFNVFWILLLMILSLQLNLSFLGSFFSLQRCCILFPFCMFSFFLKISPIRKFFTEFFPFLALP